MLSDEELPPLHESSTPLFKIRANLAKVPKNELTTTKFAVLVSTGSYSPIHRMHIRIFELARAKLESSGYNVIGGFISPSHDIHVHSKLQGEFLPAPLRAELCSLCTKDSDWIAVSSWEANCPGFVDFGRVTRSIGEFVSVATGLTNVTPFYICGADLVIRCRLYHGARQFGVVGVSRPGWTPNSIISDTIDQNNGAERTEAMRFFWIEGESVDVSSTLIRKLLAESNIDELNKLTYPEVVHSIMTQDLAKLREEALTNLEATYHRSMQPTRTIPASKPTNGSNCTIS